MNGKAYVQVWDPLLRLFHWTLAAAFLVAFSAEDDFLRLHTVAGYLVLGAIGFRLLWGFIGPRHARFRNFVVRPAVATAHAKDILRMRARRFLGHNPAGGLMIVALLLACALTALSGVVLLGAENQGPLAPWLQSTGHFGLEVLDGLHELLANLTLLLVFVHIGGVLVESWLHDENLARAMLTGRKRIP